MLIKLTQKKNFNYETILSTICILNMEYSNEKYFEKKRTFYSIHQKKNERKLKVNDDSLYRICLYAQTLYSTKKKTLSLLFQILRWSKSAMISRPWPNSPIHQTLAQIKPIYFPNININVIFFEATYFTHQTGFSVERKNIINFFIQNGCISNPAHTNHLTRRMRNIK